MTSAAPDPQPISRVRLTELTSCGGCAAKWGASELGGLVADLAAGAGSIPGLVVGLAPSDDAAVVRLTDEIALVSTTDFFPPLVDDPTDYGAIAAANACSDVFAMGGEVLVALNVAAFPESLPLPVIAEILRAAAAVVAEAGGVVAGGHTIRSEEPIFGLAVQGTVHPDHLHTKSGARPGDVLVLSKPLGTGIALAGADALARRAAIAGMRQLNRRAAQLLGQAGGAVHAVTDVTGFGLAGHAWEVSARSKVGLQIDGASLPLYPGVAALVAAGVRTGGDARNRAHLSARPVVMTAGEVIDVIAHDPQTSGGLLASVDANCVEELVSGDGGFVVIGEVVGGEPKLTFS